MRTETELLRLHTMKIFLERKAKGEYAYDVIYKDISNEERRKLKAAARKVIFRANLV